MIVQSKQSFSLKSPLINRVILKKNQNENLLTAINGKNYKSVLKYRGGQEKKVNLNQNFASSYLLYTFLFKTMLMNVPRGVFIYQYRKLVSVVKITQ